MRVPLKLSNGDIETTLTTAEGLTTTYLDHTDPDGRFTSTITGCSSGACATQYERSADELSVQKTHPDGTVLDFQYDYDPQYKTKYITDMTVTTPAGLTMTAQAARSYTDTDSNGDPDQIQKTVTVNGRTTTSLTDTLASIVSTTSPQGRTATAAYDPVTLLTSRVSVPGLLDTDYGYDSQGRLTSVTTGTRVSVLTYDSNGNLHSMEDPQHQVTTFDYDAVGRQTAVHQPDGTSVSVQYDLNGNMTVVRTPKNANHGFVYNSVNRVTAYDPPLSGDSTYTYDKDRRLIQKTFPSGKQIKNIYNLERLVQIQTPEGNVDLTYLNSNQLDTISKGAESLSYTYDGSLVTSKTSAGTLNQAISYSYNNDLQLSGTTYAGSTQSFGYDNDGLLTAAGGFAITRDANNGLPLGADDGVMNLARSFNGYGELASQAVTVNSSSVTDWNLTYNDNGQIIGRTETVAGTSASYSYEYDTAGRLIKVYKDAVLVEEYGYTDGIRSSETNTLRGITGKVYSYNTEDQLLTAGGVTYQYNADGFLWTKVDGINTTTYNYSSRGELLSVDLASGTSITYDHDPLGRRIAKKVNGAITEKYLWEGMTQLLAVYDSADQLMMRFEYADARMPVRMERGGAVYYLSYDQVGSLRVVTDVNGAVVKRIDYDSFGNILNDTAPAFEVPFGFAGGLHDRDTGLVRFGFRDYDPEVGRWTAKDPVMFLSGQTDVYGYTFSDPINFNDPLGLEADAACSVGQAWWAKKAAWEKAFQRALQTAMQGFVVGAIWGGGPNPAVPFTAGTGFLIGFGSGFVGGFIEGSVESEYAGGALGAAFRGNATGGLGGAGGAVVNSVATTFVKSQVSNIVGSKTANLFSAPIGSVVGAAFGGVIGYISGGTAGAARGIIVGGTSGFLGGGVDRYFEE